MGNVLKIEWFYITCAIIQQGYEGGSRALVLRTFSYTPFVAVHAVHHGGLEHAAQQGPSVAGGAGPPPAPLALEQARGYYNPIFDMLDVFAAGDYSSR